MTEVVGWASSIVLLVTIVAQVRKQWRTHSNKGVSRWLFVGQILASLGFTIYSILTMNAVFIATNSLLLLGSIAGILTYFRNADGGGKR